MPGCHNAFVLSFAQRPHGHIACHSLPRQYQVTLFNDALRAPRETDDSGDSAEGKAKPSQGQSRFVAGFSSDTLNIPADLRSSTVTRSPLPSENTPTFDYLAWKNYLDDLAESIDEQGDTYDYYDEQGVIYDYYVGFDVVVSDDEQGVYLDYLFVDPTAELADQSKGEDDSEDPFTEVVVESLGVSDIDPGAPPLPVQDEDSTDPDDDPASTMNLRPANVQSEDELICAPRTLSDTTCGTLQASCLTDSEKAWLEAFEIFITVVVATSATAVALYIMYSLGGPMRRRGGRHRARRKREIKKREDLEKDGQPYDSGGIDIDTPSDDERLAHVLHYVLVFARVITVVALSLYMVALWLLSMSNGWHGTTQVITALLWAAFVVLVLSLLVWCGRASPVLKRWFLRGVGPVTRRARCFTAKNERSPSGGSSATCGWCNWRELKKFCRQRLKGCFVPRQGRATSGAPTEQSGGAHC